MRYLVGRYHEVALKRGNRWRFIEQLKTNLRELFADFPIRSISSVGPRLMAGLPDEIDEAAAAERAALMFGIQNFSIVRAVPRTIDAIKREAVAIALANRAPSFRIRTSRSDKRFELTSPEIDREVGAAVEAATAMKVDLDNPALTIPIEIMEECAHISAGKIAGAGGLPVGIGGRAVALLSGGIDSPVAAYRMMGRGLRLDFVHFHSYPLVSAASREKAVDLAAHLTRYEARSTLHLVPFADAQREIVARAPQPLRVILYRRFMLRIASALAIRERARALVTGESLGQVASQTLENMTVIERAAALPILRPLVGMDKNEIVDQARRLGTFEISVLPDQDCCSLFVPRHPETHARIEEVERAEAAFEIERIVSEAVRRTEVVRSIFPTVRSGR